MAIVRSGRHSTPYMKNFGYMEISRQGSVCLAVSSWVNGFIPARQFLVAIVQIMEMLLFKETVAIKQHFSVL